MATKTGHKQATVKQRESSDGRKRSLANLKPFSKGVSGNPKGRPKTITLSEAYRQALAEQMPNDANGRSYAQAIAEMVIGEAVAGNVQAAREIADRTEGKPKQAIDMTANVLDWRELARANGLNESDVLLEAKQLIESAALTGSAESD
jgi:hypothetical protein